MRPTLFIAVFLAVLTTGCHTTPEEERPLFYHNEDGKLRMQWPTMGPPKITFGDRPEPGKRDERVTLDFDEGEIKRGDPNSFLPPMEF